MGRWWCLALVAVLLVTSPARADERARARNFIIVGAAFVFVGGVGLSAAGGLGIDFLVRQPDGHIGGTGGAMLGFAGALAGGFVAAGIPLLAIGSNRYDTARRATLTLRPTTFALTF